MQVDGLGHEQGMNVQEMFTQLIDVMDTAYTAMNCSRTLTSVVKTGNCDVNGTCDGAIGLLASGVRLNLLI